MRTWTRGQHQLVWQSQSCRRCCSDTSTTVFRTFSSRYRVDHTSQVCSSSLLSRSIQDSTLERSTTPKLLPLPHQISPVTLQDRITSDGELVITHRQPQLRQQAASMESPTSAPAAPGVSTAPALPPITNAELEQLTELIHSSRRQEDGCLHRVPKLCQPVLPTAGATPAGYPAPSAYFARRRCTMRARNAAS